MGFMFSKSEKKPSRVTSHDKAVLDLKVQRDKLTAFQKKTQTVVERETKMAKEFLAAGNKPKALFCLKKKKYQEQLLEKADGQLQNLQEMISSIEFAQVEAKVLEGLKAGNEVLNQLNKLMDIDEVEKIMQDTEDAIAYQQEIGNLLSTQLSPEDNDEIEKELQGIIEAQTKSQVPQMPAVPTHEPRVSRNVEAEEEEEEEDGEVLAGRERKMVPA